MLGVGRGYAPEMLRAHHVPVAQKRKIFAWTLDLMQRAWMGEPITLDDNPENAVEVHPRPIQQPYPPIWVAAFGPKALAQAGRLGLPYLSSPMESLTTLAQNYAQHQRSAEEEGVAKPTDVPSNAHGLCQQRCQAGGKIAPAYGRPERKQPLSRRRDVG